jgi:hypothetical protein
MITTDCINCGACEPECPNNAISQGETIFVIDPKLCTECVGFHDYEACAAVCPVDCCVTDPNNIESEEVLVARARALHLETPIGDDFASRFRKGQGKPSGPTAAKAPAPQAVPASTEAHAAAPAITVSYAGPEVDFVALPSIDSWSIPLRCLKCQQTHDAPVSHFSIGNVIFCPHCHKSMVVRDNLNYHIRTLLKDAYEKWRSEEEQFTERRERELAQFSEKRRREAQAFQSQQRRNLAGIREQLDNIGETYDAPGRPVKKGARFGWG